MKKRLLSLFLTLAMLAALLVPVSYAEDSSGKMDPVIYGLSSKTTSYWPGLRIPLNCTTDEGAAFTYTIKESSREGAIEIDEDGIVTVHKAGYFTITATAAPTAHYNGGSRDIEVNVSKCGIDSITDIDAVTTAVYNPDGISFPVNSVTLKDMRSNTLPLVKGTDYDISLSTDTPCAGENVQATFHITLKGIAAERYDMNNTLLRGPGIHMNVKVNPIAQPLHTTEAADNLPTLCKGGAAVDLSAFVENETGNAVSFDVPEGTTLTDGHILKISSGYAGSTAVVTARSAAYDVNGDGTPEYGEASVPLTFPVTAKAEAALTGIRMADWIYGETASDVSYDAVAGAGETAVSYEGIKGTAYGPSDAKPANAGKYRVTVSTQTDTCIYTGSTTFAIAKKAIDLSAAVWNYDPRSPFTYDGTPKTVTVTLPDGAAVDSYSGNTRTDAGSSLTASATVKLADGYSTDNYELVGILPTCGWKINKKSVSGIEFPVETVYGESGTLDLDALMTEKGYSDCSFSGFTASQDGPIAGFTSSGSKLTYTLKNDPANIGSSQIIDLHAENGNYKLYASVIVHVIGKFSLSAEAYTKTYDGSPVTAGQITKHADVDGTWAWAAGTETTAAADSGTKTLIFTPTDTAGYDAVPVKVDVTIAKKAVTVTGRTLTVRVGKKASVLTGSEFTVDGLVGGDELTTLPTLRYETVPDTSAAGEVAIVLTGADAGSNYSVSTVNGKLVIVPAVSGDDAASAENRITPAETSNGTVTAMPSAAAAGDTVTITVVPEAGYTLETLTVKDAKGSEIELRSKENGICTFIMPDSPVSVEAAFMEDNTMLNCFVDIPAGAYYYDAVLWAAQNRITGGVDAVRFSPGAACTRAQAVTLLWRAAGSLEVPAGRTFDDVVSGSYYEKAVVWALANGITSGTSASAFSPDAVCTRAQIVTFLARFAGGTASSAVRFSDVPADAYYAGAAAWAVENHITDGIGGNQFAPDAACTRAQIVTFLYRYLHK